MPLYHVQDDDRSLYIVATGFEDALYKWRAVISEEQGVLPTDVLDGPQGVYLICEDHELVLHETRKQALKHQPYNPI